MKESVFIEKGFAGWWLANPFFQKRIEKPVSKYIYRQNRQSKMAIQTIRIQNFKSIRDSGDVELRPLNVLIGANGVGKSNFISFFKFLNKIYEGQLQLHVGLNGRAENFLYFGRKQSPFLNGKIVFDNAHENEYEFTLLPDQEDNFVFEDEWSNYKKGFIEPQKRTWRLGSAGQRESSLGNDKTFHAPYLNSFLKSFRIFHFHDTGFNSKIKQPCSSIDYAWLREDGGNLAAFLYLLQEKHKAHFMLIQRTIRSIAPFFDKFYLQPDEKTPEQIFLRWFEFGSEQPFTAHNFSDGTLRMICLCTLLMQPNPPATIIIDEPELGLHPSAIEKLAAMLKTASLNSQIIVSTQSVNLLNYFEPEDILVVNRADNQSVFKRLDSDELEVWLDEYSLSDLWDKNIFGGRP